MNIYLGLGAGIRSQACVRAEASCSSYSPWNNGMCSHTLLTSQSDLHRPLQHSIYQLFNMGITHRGPAAVHAAGEAPCTTYNTTNKNDNDHLHPSTSPHLESRLLKNSPLLPSRSSFSPPPTPSVANRGRLPSPPALPLVKSANPSHTDPSTVPVPSVKLQAGGESGWRGGTRPPLAWIVS